MKKFLFLSLFTALLLSVSCQKEANPESGPSVVIENIHLDPTEVTLSIGETVQIEYILEPQPEESCELTWTTSDSEIAAVTGGLVTAKSEGEAIITASFEKIQASCLVKVTKKEDPVTEKFQITTEKIHSSSIEKIKVTAPDSDMTFYTCLIEKDRFLEEGGEKGITEFDKSWWEFLASASGENFTWVDAMKLYLSVGSKEFESSEFLNYLKWNTEYVIYAYGIDPEGNITTDVSMETVRTLENKQSDKNIDIQIQEVKNDGVVIDIVTDLEQSYLLTAQSADFWNRYQDDQESLVYALLDVFYNPVMGLDGYFFTGNQKDLYLSGNSADSDYYVIAFGFDPIDGLTTEVIGIPFHTAPL